MRDQPRLIEDLPGRQRPRRGALAGLPLSDIPSVDVDNRAGHARGPGASRRPRSSADRLHRRTASWATSGPRGRLPGVHGRPCRRMPASSTPPTTSTAARTRSAACSTGPAGRPPWSPPRMCRRWGRSTAPTNAGVRVPEDLSVTGFDDIPFATASIPALTTVRMPVREMVAEALRLVFDAPDAPTRPTQSPVARPVARRPRVDRPPGRLTRRRLAPRRAAALPTGGSRPASLSARSDAAARRGSRPR